MTSYLSAEQLKITQPEYDGLLWVLENLRNGTIKERPQQVDAMGEGFFLDMGTEFSEPPCGTVACIGGWVAARTGLDPAEAVRYVDRLLQKPDHPLTGLYWDELGTKVGPQQAAAAIENFLCTSDPRWHEVMGRTE